MADESEVLVFFVDSDIYDGSPHANAFNKVKSHVEEVINWNFYKGGKIRECEVLLVLHSDAMTTCLAEKSLVDVNFGDQTFQFCGKTIKDLIERSKEKVFVAELGELSPLPDGHVLKAIPKLQKMNTANPEEGDYEVFAEKIVQYLEG